MTKARATHTPGPWSIGESHNDGVEIISAPDAAGGPIGGKSVATVRLDDMDPEEIERNADLLAAAPDLLEACERLAAKIENSGEAWMSDPDWQFAAAAIARARGEN